MYRAKIKTFLRSFQLKVIERAYPYMPYVFRTYRYRVRVTNALGIREKLPLLLYCFRRNLIDRKTILFYPDGPMPFHAMYKILIFLGYHVTSDTKRHCDVAIKWWLAFDGSPFYPENSFPQFKNTTLNGVNLVNSRCNDISKVRVNAVFEEIFGYQITVDPRKHIGKCVMKLNWNALHKGQVIECPTEPHDGDFVYQKLIQNEVDSGLVEDMRVPIFGKKTPFVYLKYRAVKDRLVDRVHTNTKAIIAEVSDVLSENEMINIYRFCERIGMDYGELDVLRDRADGLIYIVDANNTPSGPPTPISDDEAKVAIVRLSEAFEEAFGF